MATMMERIRNIGIIAHIDAGKTTLTERMLFYSGAKHRFGNVDQGTTDTDDDPEEQQRGITIFSACVKFDWQDAEVNLLDTPGHVDFTAEVERCLRVLDGAVVVFSAREGVEAQSETVWRQADKYGVPRIVFINKLDREGASFETVFNEIGDRLKGEHDSNPVPTQIPVGEGPSHVDSPFSGVIDLITMEMLAFDSDTEGREYERKPIPDEHLATANLWRELMLDKLYNINDEMMELALEGEEVPPGLIRKVIRAGTIERLIQPVLCGSALQGIGVQPVLDAVLEYLPSPLDRPPVEGESGDEKKAGNTSRKPSAKEPFCGLVFKVVPAKTGNICWIRVYSGELKSNSRIFNPGKKKKDNAAQIWQLHATKKDYQLEKLSAGDIGGVIGFQHSITGDTICDAKAPILLETIEFPETVISMAVEPETTTERKKLNEVLDMLMLQDPTVHVEPSETGQTLIRGMGELHLEVIKNRLLRDFNLKVRFHNPQVSYRETVSQSVDVVGECHRQVSGVQLFAELKISVEPFEGGVAPVTVLNKCPVDVIPPDLLAVAVEELKICGEGGGLIGGFPLSKIKVTVTGGAASETSDAVAFRIAANDAFEKGLREGGPVLLEPIMRLQITTPEDYVGDFVGDLQQRRAIIARTDARGAISTIEAHAPLKELFGYSGAMRSLSQGRAGCSMEPLEYSAAPPEVMKGFQFDD